MHLTGTPLHRERDGDRIIEVFDEDGLRWLVFGDGVVQSVIDVNEPALLPSPVARAVLACLLFVPAPDRVLLLGAGGGSLARYLHARRPGVRGDAVERSAAVADVTRRFFDVPGSDQGWRLLVADARDHLAVCETGYDLVVADFAEGDTTPAWLAGEAFLRGCRRCLSRTGVLAVNLLVDDSRAFKRFLAAVRQAFDRRTLCLSVPDHRNLVVFAFTAAPRYRRAEDLAARAVELQAVWGLEFAEFLARLLEDNPPGSGVL
jgi:spermidine synthase